MILVQLPLIKTDSTIINVDTFEHIPGSIKQPCGRGDRKRKKYNIKRQITGKGMTHPEIVESLQRKTNMPSMSSNCHPHNAIRHTFIIIFYSIVQT